MEEISQKDDLVIPNEPGCLMTEVVLKTQEAGKSYTLKRKRVQALKNVTLEIKRGEFVAIMGNSGSGKTSLLSMLGCLDRPSTGKVFVDGICVSEMRDSHLFKIRRDKIGFVFQSYNLLPYLNARENVELAMESTKKSKMERSVRALETVGRSGLVWKGRAQATATQRRRAATCCNREGACEQPFCHPGRRIDWKLGRNDKE